MKVRFIADYDFNGEIIDGLVRREPSIDFLTGFEAGLEGIPDRDVLGKAANEGRVLVTHERTQSPRRNGGNSFLEEQPDMSALAGTRSFEGSGNTE